MEYRALSPDKGVPKTQPRCVALGIFDGLHLGHRRVISAASQGMPDGVLRTVYTFQPHTLTTKKATGRLCLPAQRDALLEGMGVDELLEVDFATVCDLSPAEFVEQVLHRQLGAVQVSCGYNYRFGKGGRGDVSTLTALCEARGIKVQVVDSVEVDGQPVSSTAIRQALAEGDMDTARRLLGRGYRLCLPVVAGQHLGHRLGMPTINQPIPADLVCPRYGVYASCVEVDGQILSAVTNIGVRPTVGADAPLAETWILDFDGDLYGTTPSVYPLAYLREEQKFSSLEELQRQVAQDAAVARALLTPPQQPAVRAILFDFDDTLGDRDAAFRIGLEAFIRYYRPTLSDEEVIALREEMFRFNREGYGTPIAYENLVEHFLNQWGCNADRKVAYRRLCDGFSDHYPIHEDVIPTLIELRRRGYRLGIVTNGGSYPQNRKMDRSGLRTYVDLVVVGGDEKVQKPNPLIFRRTAARLGIPAECCLFVGDHPRTDIAGALSAGMQVIRKDAAHAPDHPFYGLPCPDTAVIHQILELLDLFPEIE